MSAGLNSFLEALKKNPLSCVFHLLRSPTFIGSWLSSFKVTMASGVFTKLHLGPDSSFFLFFCFSLSLLITLESTQIIKDNIFKLKLQYFGHLMPRANSLEKTLMLGKIECRKSGQQRMSWVASSTQWT